MNLFKGLLEAKGYKRTLGFVLLIVGKHVAPAVPVLAPFGEALSGVGEALIGVGVAHALVAK